MSRTAEQPEPADQSAGTAVDAGGARSEVVRGIRSVRQGAAIGTRLGGAHGAVIGGIAGAAGAVARSRHRRKILIGLLCLALPNLAVFAMLGLSIASFAGGFSAQLSTQAMSRNQAAGAIDGDQAAVYAEASARSGIHWAVLAAVEKDVSISTLSTGADGADSTVPLPDGDAGPQLDVEVATWNVLKSNAPDRVVAGIEALGARGAGVIGLQELRANHIRAIERELDRSIWGWSRSHNAVMLVWRKDRVRPVYERSRQLFGRHRVEPGAGGTSLAPRSIQTAEFTTSTGARFGVINNHIVPTIETRAHPHNPKRLALAYTQFEAVVAIVDGLVARNVPALVTGDHNISARADATVRFGKFPFVSYARHGLYANWRTLGYPREGTHAGGRLIDYVFATNALAAPTAQRIEPSWGSDHRAVLVSVSNRPGARPAASATTTFASGTTPSGTGPSAAGDAGAGPYRLVVDSYNQLAAQQDLDPITKDQAENADQAGAAIGRLFTRLLARADPALTADSLTAGTDAAETTDGQQLSAGTDTDSRAVQQRVRSAYVTALRQLPIPDADLKAGGWYDLALALALGNPPQTCAGTGPPPAATTPPFGASTPHTQASLPGSLIVTDANGNQMTLDAVQIRHAAEIIGVGRSLDLNSRLIQTALMTALQESGLKLYANSNVPESLAHPHDAVGHDHDSVNLMQQRPGAWGSVKQLMRVDFAVRMFYGGPTKPKKDGARGLLDIPGHQTMPMGRLAQTVQVSAFPAAYDKWQPVAATLLEKIAGIAASEPITASECGTVDQTPGTGAIPGDCAEMDAQLVRKNPLSCAQAIRKAVSRVDGACSWYRMCLAFTADSYGWHGSGQPTAYRQYLLLKSKGAVHAPDPGSAPPVGALVYWKGPDRAGHIALVVAPGKIASNDIRRHGCIDVVAWDAPATQWHERYLGWSVPWYPTGG